jgi:MIP family channel proteins
MHSRSAKLAAELFGAFVLVLAAAGASRFSPPGPALAYGAVFGVLVAVLGRISGGHFNPAVTIGHWVTHRFGTFTALGYCGAQLAGAACAAYVLQALVPDPIQQATALGAPGLAAGLTRGPAMLVEGSMTFFLVFAIFATTVNKTTPRYWLAGLVGGAAITLGVLAGGALTGSSMNPAREFGLALASRRWAFQGVYWIGPLGGGVAAAFLYDLLFRRKHSIADPTLSPDS